MLHFIRNKVINEPQSIPSQSNFLAMVNGRTLNETKNPTKASTRQDQDEADHEKARQQAVKDLVQSWSDRLQLISVITTFFASTEAGLLQNAIPKPGDAITRLSKFSNACLIGALAVHIFAAVTSFLAAFLLVSYRVKVARREEEEVDMCNSARVSVTKTPEATPPRSLNDLVPLLSYAGPNAVVWPRVWSANPHIEQVGLFSRPPPTRLLGRCHLLCIIFAIVGFLLALVGTVCYAWDSQPVGVSVFATTCVSICVISVIGILL